MKLISLYIDNFGKLSDYSYDFSSKLNSLYEENGWGKTTLTVFIKSMLYGLSKNERIQYTPWKNLSTFGGCLVIEANGREYRIERQFSPLKASADVLKVFDLRTNKEVSFDNNIGEALLNLNETSFERSVFIPQKDLEEGFGSDIEAKLANLIGGTDDTQSFDQAIEILKNKSHELKLNSKKGLIVDKKMELAQIEDEIEEVNVRMKGLPTLRTTVDQINDDILALTNEKRDLNNKIVTFTKTQDKRAKLEVVNKYEQDIRWSKLQLEKNNEVFNGKNVTVEEVLSYRAKNKELQTLKTQYEVKLQNNRASQKVLKLEKEVNLTDVPDDETIEHITDQILKYNNIKSAIQRRKDEPKAKIKPKTGIALTVMASILLLIGVGLFMMALFFFKNQQTPFMISGLAVSILAILCYIGALAAFIVTNQKNSALQVGGQVAAYDYEKIHLEEEIREFFGKYHIYSSDFTNNLFKIRTAIQRYKDATEEASDIALENQNLENKIKEYEESIRVFLGQFNSSPSCITNEEKIGELNTHLRNRNEIENNINEKERILKSFISDNELSSVENVNVNAEEINSKIEEIDSKIESLNKAKATYINKMQDYENEISQYDDLVAKKEECEGKIRAMEEQLRLITLSMDYLSQSQTALLEKYVNPMKDSVNKYVTLLLKDSSDYNIDVNFKFQFVTNTGLKSIESYSRGLQTLISLCMRLALIDCLYPNEKPFVILDDPFVNFDDEKLELCKALIRAISVKFQIVYFTCHKSREIALQGKTLAQVPKQQTDAKAISKPEPIKPVVLNPIPSNAKVRVAAPVEPRVQSEPQAPKPVVRAKGADDVFIEEINKANSEVKPQGVKLAKRSVDDGGLGPMMSRGQNPTTDTAKPTRTITIKKK